MEIFPIYIMSLYRMSDKDLEKRIRISDVVFKDLEESLMIFGESSKIVIFMNVVQVVGQPLLDIHSGNLTAAHPSAIDSTRLSQQSFSFGT